MKYECSIDINVPINEVVTLFKDPKNLRKWQDGLVSYEPILGTPGKVGAKSKLTFINGKDTIELIETIEVMNLPEEMIARYEHKYGENTMIHQFTALKTDSTQYRVVVGYVKMKGFLPKVMSVFNMVRNKKQNEKWLKNFKKFVLKEHWGKAYLLRNEG